MADTIPADTSTTATISLDTPVNGVVDASYDHDWYRISLTAGVYDINMTGNYDTFLYVHNASGTTIASDDDAGAGLNSYLRLTITTAGTYYLDAAGWTSSYGSFSLTITRTPDAVNDSLASTPEDSPLNVNVSTLLANDSDPAGNALSVSQVSNAVGGSVSLASGVVTFTPSANYSGGASFQYTISDGFGGSDIATASFTVTPVPDAPIALDDHPSPATLLTFNDGNGSPNEQGFVFTNFSEYPSYGAGGTGMAYATNGTMTRADGAEFDLNSMSLSAYTSPGSVTLEGYNNGILVATQVVSLNTYTSPSTVTFTGAWAAVDEVRFILTSGEYVFIDNVDIGDSGGFAVAENSTIAIDVLANDQDADGDAISVTDVSDGAHGTTTINPDGTVQFTPDAGYDGPDSFTYMITDSTGRTSSATVSMNVMNVDDPPVAQDDSFTTSELNVATGNLFADNGSGADSDPDGPALAISEVNGNSANVGTQITLTSGALLTVNADGTFSYNPNGAFEYTPTAGSGASNTPSSDSFTYTLAGGDTATVNLTITGADNNDLLLGTSNNDFISGGAGTDTMYGGDGNDTLSGGGANDMVYGEGGNDRLTGGGGNDTLDGGSGDDYSTGGFGDDLINGGGGIDRAGWYQTDPALGGATVSLLLQGAAQNTGSQGSDTLVGIDNLSGTPFADVLTGDDNNNWLWGSPAFIGAGNISSTNNDTIDAGGGDDLVWVGFGDHSLAGGSDIDTLQFTENFGDDPPISISLGQQGSSQDTGQGFWTLSGFENLVGGTAGDSLTGDGNTNLLIGGGGSDALSGGGGNDTLYGDAQLTFIGNVIGVDPSSVNGGAEGNDTLEGGLGDDNIDGGGGVDTASYANASGGVTAFLYRAGTGNGEAFGADGDDTLANIENLTGSAFNDQLGGNNLANVLSGGDGHDGLRGNGGNDTLLGGGGDDFLNGSAGDDFVDGGAGSDRAAFYENATSAGVTVDLNLQGTAQDTGQGMDTLVNIENVSGSAYGDHLTGDGNDNWLWGSASTLLDGTIVTTNNDTLDGGGGNDLLVVGIGNHVVDGGSGIDTFRFSENGAPETGITLSLLLAGTAQASGNGNWTLTGIENLSGSTAGDNLTGDGNANVLAGDLGDDLLSGGAGNDVLYGDGQISWDGHGTGGSGPITTWADATSLYVGGVPGNDTLEGGDGDDQLWGGGGSDTASYASASGGVTALLYNSGFGEAFGAAGYDQLHDMENLTGSMFNDILIGNNIADNVITGGDGHDLLRGNGGNDTLLGGDGDDYLDGGLGDDILDGGAGLDRLSYFGSATGAVTIDLRIQGVAQDTGQGMDTLIGIEHAGGTVHGDTLIGNEGDNWLRGSSDGAGNDIVDGQGGNDLIEDGAGDHQLDGGAGIDTFLYAPVSSLGINVSLALQGEAQDTGVGMMTLSGFENLSGWRANDTLIGDAGNNILAGDQGHDTLVGGAGNDSLYGDGAISIDTHGTNLSGPITLYPDVATLGGASGNDLLEGGLGDDLVDGGGGVDTASYANASGGVTAFLYRAGTGNGEAFGADGDDTLANIENLTGSAFNDQLGGNNLANVLSGGDGHDGLRGNGGNDTLLGGGGDDFLNGSAGDDFVDGGAGSDRAAFYENATSAGVTVDLNLQGTAQDTGQGMDTLVNIENVSGSAYGDHLTGDGNDNWLWGSASTLLDGTIVTTNNDTLDGGGGNDLLVVGIGNHSLTGGTGTDTVAFSENGAPEGPLTVSLALQDAAQATGNGSWTLSGIENLSGGGGNDSLTGDGNANVLAGNLGNDTLVGGAGNDTLLGDGQILWDGHGTGGSGPITTFPDVALIDPAAIDGNDTLEGGLGNDVINGGGGVDTATYAHASGGVTVNLGSGTSSGADGNDTLTNIENVTGSEFNDTLSGSGGGNVIDGLGGNDSISGGAGDDVITGGDGDDFLQGDLSDNNITAIGNDLVYGGNGNDGLRGGLGDDQLFGGANNDLLRGNGGVDYFDGGADDGEGFNGIGDRVSFFEQRATQGAIADLRTGIISNDGFGNIETMVGIESLGADTAFVDTFYGNDGRNYLAGSRGDNLYGFGGDDAFTMTSATAVVDGGTGTDRLSLFVGSGWLLPDANGDGLAELATAATAGWTVNLAAGTLLDGYGNTGSVTGIENVDGSGLGDTLIGDANANALNGLDGNDTLNGRGGNDTLDGGAGIDTASYVNASGAVTVDLGLGIASGADGNDTLANIENATGSAFSDTILGNGGDNLLTGGSGHDYLRSEGGNDNLSGGDGDDFLNGGAGDDIIDGGNGIDRVAYSVGATAGVTVNLSIQGVAQNTGSAGMDTLIGIEQLSGTIFNDTLTGDGASNWIWGGSNGSGVTGNDTINAGAGDDLVEVGAGTHTLIGGTGIDTLSLWGNSTDISAAGVTFSLASQGAAQNTLQGMMNASGFENVSGSRYNDTLTGDAGANILLGDTGSDTLNGGDGNDTLYGDGRMLINGHETGTAGAITLFGDVEAFFGNANGADGNDTLNGGKGDDTIYGGRGNDVMSGNPGADKFVIEAQSGADRITDFAHIDRIVFDPSSGVSAFSSLVFTAVGKDTVISWGTSDSLTIVGYKPKDLTAADFTFGPSAAASSMSISSLSEQSRTAAVATSNQMLQGTVAAAGMASLSAAPLAATSLASSSTDGGVGTLLGGNTFDGQSSGFGDLSSIGDLSRSALGGEFREAAALSSGSLVLNIDTSSSLGGSFAGLAYGAAPVMAEMSQGTMMPTLSEFGLSGGLATGVAIPAAEMLVAMNAVSGAVDVTGTGQVTAEVWRGVADAMEGDGPNIDGLLDLLPGHGDMVPAIAASLASVDFMSSPWLPASGMSSTDMLALHHDAIVTG